MATSFAARSLAVLACVLIGALHPVRAAPGQTAQKVVYRCTLADGQVQYTNVPRAGCVVLFTYVPKAVRPRLRGNPSTQLIEHGSYVNRDGIVVHRPAHTVSGAAPPGASAQCRDGSYSFSLHHRGTCSHHGGVARWL